MKNTKLFEMMRLGAVALIGIAATGLATSCEGSGGTETGVSNAVVGTGGKEPTAFIGTSLPFSADLYAADTIAGLGAELRTATGGDVVLAEIYTDGLEGHVRAKVEQNIDLPEGTDVGNYVLLLTVTDKAGQQETTEHPVRLMIDTSLPVVLDLEIGINAAGNDLHLASHVTAPNKLAKITVTVKGESWENQYVFDGSSIVGKIDHHFHEHTHVDEAPKGDYEVTVTATDQDGATSSAIGTFTKK